MAEGRAPNFTTSVGERPSGLRAEASPATAAAQTTSQEARGTQQNATGRGPATAENDRQAADNAVPQPAGPPVGAAAPARPREPPPQPNGQPQAAEKPQQQQKATAAVENDPLRDLLAQMDRLRPQIAATDRSLADTVRVLAERSAEPGRVDEARYRTVVSYALQDLEKRHSIILQIPAELRRELTGLAATAPGLENDRMKALLVHTPSIEDRALVKEIRVSASKMGQEADQHTAQAASSLDALENKVRLARRPAEPVAQTVGQPASAQAATPPPSGATTQAASDRQPSPDANRTSAGTQSFSTPRDAGLRSQGKEQDLNPTVVQSTALDTLLRAIRPESNQTPPVWERTLTPMAERVATAEKRTMARQDEEAFTRLEQRGSATLDAFKGLASSETANVMSRINAAIQAESGGAAKVLSEMRDGGRFADLRKQFGNAVADDKGFAAAYDKAADTLGSYAKNRSTVEEIISRRPDAAALTQRFEKLDAEIGQAAARTPSKTEGRSMMDDLAKQAKELIERAVTAIQSVFSRSPSAEASARAAPAPAM